MLTADRSGDVAPSGDVRMSAQSLNGPDDPEILLPLFPRKGTQVGHRAVSVSCQNRTFVAGFLAITSNARHAERSNGRCPVLPHRPGPSRSTASAGSPNDRGATWHNLRSGVSADCPFRPHAHVLVWSIQYWPSVRYCGMNCPTARRVPQHTDFEVLTKLGGTAQNPL